MSLKTVNVDGNLEVVNEDIMKVLDGFAVTTACITPEDGAEALLAMFVNRDEVASNVRIFIDMAKVLSRENTHKGAILRDIRLPWLEKLQNVVWQADTTVNERMPTISVSKRELLSTGWKHHV